MRKLLKNNPFLANSSVYLLSNMLNAAIPFAILPVLTRYLDPEQYGELAMFQILLGVLNAVVGLSVHGAAGRKYYDKGLTDAELGEYIGSCLQILLVTSFVAVVISLAFSALLAEWLSLDAVWILLAVLATSSSVLVQLRLGQWQVRKLAKRYGALQVTSSLLGLILSLILVVVFLNGSDGRIAAQIITAILFGLLALWLLKKDGLLVIMVWRYDYIREILRFGVPLIPHVVGGFLLFSVDRFLIKSQLGLMQAGIYMLAVQLSLGVRLLFDAINKAYVPWLFEKLKGGSEYERRKIVKYTYVWFAVILCGAGMAFLIGPWLVVVVAGERYSSAGELIGWLVLGQVFRGMYLMVTNYIFYSKQTGLLSLATIASGLINVALVLVLLKQFGIVGAAYAFCISSGIYFLLAWWVAQKRHPMPWFNFNS